MDRDTKSRRRWKIYDITRGKLLLEQPQLAEYWGIISSLHPFYDWSFRIRSGEVIIKRKDERDVYQIPFHSDYFDINGRVDYYLILEFFKLCVQESARKQCFLRDRSDV